MRRASRCSTRRRSTTGRSCRGRRRPRRRIPSAAGMAGAGGFMTGAPSFQHASVPPTPISPINGAAASGPVVFRWSTVPEQVRNYTIEVAQDDSFSTILEQSTTDATAYSANTTFPVGATVFWRVRVNNDDGKGLAWSATSSFVQTLPAPTITTAEPFVGETFPALTWNPVDGATSYEVQDVWADASVHVTSNIPSTAVSYVKMTGTGHGTVQVRAVFPGGFKSAFTPTRDVVHTIGKPQGAHTLFNKKTGALTLVWKSKPNAKSYKVQLSRSPGFVAAGSRRHDRSVGLHAAQGAAGVQRWRPALLARGRDRPRRQHGRVLEGGQADAAGAHDADRVQPAGAQHARASRRHGDDGRRQAAQGRRSEGRGCRHLVDHAARRTRRASRRSWSSPPRRARSVSAAPRASTAPD